MSPPLLPHEALCFARRNDLTTFVRAVFKQVSPGDIYRQNWHIDAITHQLTRVREDKLKRLIITQPPRSLKSICTSVAFPAWALGHDPRLRFGCVSYSSDLALTFARQFRSVMASPWYRELFPRTRLAKETESECETSLGGGRIAVSVNGTLTGRGADILILDDPLKADDAQSEKARPGLNAWYSNTLWSRLNDKRTGAIILVMQRLHEDDLAGKLLNDGGWEHLDLPAIAVSDQKISTGPSLYHNRKQGDLLHPEREPAEVLEQAKREMGSLRFSAQYQQRPVPLEGNLVKRKWFRWYDTLPERAPGRQYVQSWDVATSVGSANDFSVCTTWLVEKRTYYLADVWRDRVEFPELRRKVISLGLQYDVDTILIERVGAGDHLVQEFRNGAPFGIPLPIGIWPQGEKQVRMDAQSARIEAGQVHLPRDAPWLDDFLNEILGFPHSRNDDQVDSVSQFLNWIEQRVSGTADIFVGAKLIS